MYNSSCGGAVINGSNDIRHCITTNYGNKGKLTSKPSKIKKSNNKGEGINFAEKKTTTISLTNSCLTKCQAFVFYKRTSSRLIKFASNLPNSLLQEQLLISHKSIVKKYILLILMKTVKIKALVK